jgi:cysteine desulfurase/selenocysteine lyase
VSQSAYDVDTIRKDFPILDQQVNGHPLVFLDSAASAQKPRQVIEAISQLYSKDYANIHRGVYQLSERATAAFEASRQKAARFIGANPREIVFVRGTTEAINLVAQTFGRVNVGAGDEILITAMEHHSNIVPWQMLCEEKGANLRVAPIDEIIRIAHEQGAPVLVDGAQAIPHDPVDVRALDCDFYAFSSHKVFGPSGIGVLYGKAEHLEAMPPWQGGGEMILSVTFEKSTYNEIPHKFEAGTPDIAGVVGFGAALDYVDALDRPALASYERDLLDYGTAALEAVPGVRLIGTAPRKSAVLSFVIDGIHPHDVGTILDQHGIAVRTGHHCAQPVMERFGVPATVRASLALYNTRADLDALVKGIHAVRELFA